VECVQKPIIGALKNSYVKSGEGVERKEESEDWEVKRHLQDSLLPREAD
jgi:hypothetical protein